MWLPMEEKGPNLRSVGESALQKYACQSSEVAEIDILARFNSRY